MENELARLQRNQDRRIARNATKANAEGIVGGGASTAPGTTTTATPAHATSSKQTGSKKGVGKGKSTTRKCATCGEIGHIKTNKSCPMYNETYGAGGNSSAQ